MSWGPRVYWGPHVLEGTIGDKTGDTRASTVPPGTLLGRQEATSPERSSLDPSWPRVNGWNITRSTSSEARFQIMLRTLEAGRAFINQNRKPKAFYFVKFVFFVSRTRNRNAVFRLRKMSAGHMVDQGQAP